MTWGGEHDFYGSDYSVKVKGLVSQNLDIILTFTWFCSFCTSMQFKDKLKKMFERSDHRHQWMFCFYRNRDYITPCRVGELLRQGRKGWRKRTKHVIGLKNLTYSGLKSDLFKDISGSSGRSCPKAYQNIVVQIWKSSSPWYFCQHVKTNWWKQTRIYSRSLSRWLLHSITLEGPSVHPFIAAQNKIPG